MSHTIEIETESRVHPPQHLNGVVKGPRSPIQSSKLNGSHVQISSPSTPDFIKKANGNHVEVETPKPCSTNGFHRTTTSPPIKESSKAVIIEDVKQLKADGDKLYNEKRYADAIYQYKLSLGYVHYDPKFESDKMVVNKSIYTKILSNIGQCLTKQDKVDEAIVYLSQVIKLDPANIKAYYRLAHLFNKKNEADRASEVLRKGMVYIPDLQDEQLKKFYTDYYSHTQSLQNIQLDGLKSRMKSYCMPKRPPPPAKNPFTRALAASLVASSLTTGGIAFTKDYSLNAVLVALPANFLLWQVVIGTEDRRKRFLAIAGLIGINIAVWKFL